MFIEKVDLSTSLFPEIRDILARYSDTIILSHCATAESEIESYLSQRYDIRPELEKTGNDRHKLLLQIGRDIAIYHLYQLAETIKNSVVKRYDDAIRLLDDIAKGKIILPGVASAPPPEAGTPAGDQIAFGSRTPRAALYP
jgi:phage gp36-like protein